ncbi:MAG: cobalt ECF transporter T component CbiQ [Candidatus Abyssobacteria bacterium SURF_5]|uniref:Cobalt ECF transporter T component CbiQ n=1 Tax=Abyssobacteria bacterium (strain SURF_5) TaxID=2093360 RepID=A0A3A4P2H7_ABYX5|nr:MAG: cobalt ECF transporter T component CbiQ [Candidatus Abyssubacteria bacterium SURF_5]
MLEQDFSAGSSWIHRLDPRVKIISATGFSVVTALLSRHPALASAACAAFVLIVQAQLPVRPLLRRLVIVNFFVLFLWLTLPIRLAGAAPIQLGPVGIAPDGFSLALILTIKSNAIVAAGIALLATNRPAEIARGLHRLRVPAKIVQILLFMLRYLSEIEREYGWMKAAMTMRGFRPTNNLRTYKAYAHLIGLLLIVSYEKAQAIHAAMLCRGFDGRFYVLDERPRSRADMLFAASMAAVLMLLLYLQLV